MPSQVPFFSRLSSPFLRMLDPETGHRLAICALSRGWVPAAAAFDDAILHQSLWGLDFANPLGSAAGFDKNAEAVAATLALGFGFVEVGTVTPRPQPGNPRPRLFRLVEDEAVINRMGFNNQGLEAVLGRLKARRPVGIVAVNLGRNKDSADAVADYVEGVRHATPLASFLVINVSSPNTPGLRGLQRRQDLAGLLGAAKAARDEVADRRPPLLVKIAPDLTEAELADIAAVALDTGIDGIVATNTTIGRPASLRGSHAREPGGLSGRPLFGLSTQVLGSVYRLTGGRLPLIGVGGVASGADAYAKIRAGASLVQLYTAMVYGGPGIVADIRRDLAALVKRDGFSSVAEAVGADHR
jgi:dihydroorotate dehydrogenase